MSIRKKIFLCGAIAFCAYISAANADTYVSVNMGSSYAYKTNWNGRSRSGFLGIASNLFLGDRVTTYFGPEVGIGYYGLQNETEADALTILGLNGRLNIPVTPLFNVFGKLGIGLGELKTCHNGCQDTQQMVPTFGVGAGINFLPRWMASIEFNGAYFPQSTKNGHGPMGGLTIGVTRYFG